MHRARFSHIVLVVISMLGSFGLWAQLDSAEIEYRKTHRTYKAMKDIMAMKEGVLLVRLNTKFKTIEALENHKAFKEAEQVRAAQKEWNKKVVGYFKTHYTFTPVYFFFSTETDKVKRRDFASVHFLDSELQPLENQPVISANFWIAEINYLDRNTRTGSDMGFEAILLRDSSFTQLDHPFPFYTRTLRSVVPERHMPEAMRRFNEKLHSFHSEMNNKRELVERREFHRRRKEQEKALKKSKPRAKSQPKRDPQIHEDSEVQ